jgi:parallel beta-helix repeat protein
MHALIAPTATRGSARLPRAALTIGIVLALSLAAVGSSAAAATGTTFVVSRTGSTYVATSTATTFTGSLKRVVERAVDSLGSAGGTISFSAGDFDLGSEWFTFKRITNITFEGAGIGITRIRNSSSAGTDTEPFDIVGASSVVIRDLSVAAGGAPRSTSDAIDFDDGSNVLIERVAVTESRARGIVFDGKGAGWSATGNVIRDCMITGIPGKGIELLAASGNLIEGCTITDVGGQGIQINKSSTSAAQPNKPSNDNVVRGNTILRGGGHGIEINSGSRNVLAGNTILDSGQLVTSRDGIRIGSNDGVVCDDNAVAANRSGNAVGTTQSWGLNIASSLCHRTVIGVGNDFDGNRLGPIRDLGTATRYEPIVDTQPPSVPAGLQATAPSSCGVELAWQASTDDVGVTGYGVYRDGALLASVDGSLLTYTDRAIAPGAAYAYQVDAVDAAGNHSALSSPVALTVPTEPCTLVLVPTDDSWVDASQPTANFGTKTQVRVDGSPTVVAYLRFAVPEHAPATHATLRIYANSNHSVGFAVHAVADSSWSERTITYATAPTMGPSLVPSGPFATGSWVEVDVTPLLDGAGPISIALTTTSSTAMSLGSRESSTAPQLVLSGG